MQTYNRKCARKRILLNTNVPRIFQSLVGISTNRGRHRYKLTPDFANSEIAISGASIGAKSLVNRCQRPLSKCRHSPTDEIVNVFFFYKYPKIFARLGKSCYLCGRKQKLVE